LGFNFCEEQVLLGSYLNGSILFSFDVILELEIVKLYSITLLIYENVLESISRRLWLSDYIFAIYQALSDRPTGKAVLEP
jgi:hypothetical protein